MTSLTTTNTRSARAHSPQRAPCRCIRLALALAGCALAAAPAQAAVPARRPARLASGSSASRPALTPADPRAAGRSRAYLRRRARSAPAKTPRPPRRPEEGRQEAAQARPARQPGARAARVPGDAEATTTCWAPACTRANRSPTCGRSRRRWRRPSAWRTHPEDAGARFANELNARLVGLRSYLDTNNAGAPEGTYTSTLPAFDGTVAPPVGPGGPKYYDDNDWVGIELRGSTA